MEASALQAPAGLTRGRASLGSSFLRLRSDDQLVELFRAGNDDAFRVIHDRYRTRLFAYTRQMLPGSRQDAEDALQDVFVKAYSGLRAHDRQFALRAWLYRVAHNRCIDQLRRPVPVMGLPMEPRIGPLHDPIVAAEQRETLRRLIADVQRLPDHQRSALLMRELSGMSYAELAEALGLSVPAVKSLLVRARVSLAAALEARETACSEIREELVLCHDRGVRPTPMARRHLHDCAGCRDFRRSVRGVSRNFAAIVPAAGPAAFLGKLLGIGGGAAAGSSGAAAGGGVTASGFAASAGAIGTGGAFATGLMTTGAGHVASLLAAAVVAAGGAVEIQAGTVSGHHQHAGVTQRSGRLGGATAGARTGEPDAAGAVPVTLTGTSSGYGDAVTARVESTRTSLPQPAPAAPGVSGGSASSMNLASPDAIAGAEPTGSASSSTATGGSTISVPISNPSSTSTGTDTGTTGYDTAGTADSGGSSSDTGSTGSGGTGSSSTGTGSTSTGDSSGTGTGTAAGSGENGTGSSSASSGTGSTSSTGSTGTSSARFTVASR